MCNVFVYVYKKSDFSSYENLQNFLLKAQDCSLNRGKKKTLIICNDFAPDDFSILDKKSNLNYQNEIENQEILIKKLSKQFRFTLCNLSKLNKNFLQEFLIDFV